MDKKKPKKPKVRNPIEYPKATQRVIRELRHLRFESFNPKTATMGAMKSTAIQAINYLVDTETNEKRLLTEIKSVLAELKMDLDKVMSK
jgi:hypothetical protein